MTTVAHFHPAARLFNSVFANPALAGTAPDLSIDVAETDAAYVLRADVPGVAKDDINVSVDGNVVRLEVEFKEEVTEGTLWRERRTGKVSRALKFAQPLEADGATAKHEHGVLTLTVPKKADAQVKRITIQ